MKKKSDDPSLVLDAESYFYRRINEKAFFLRKEFEKSIDRDTYDITGSKALIGTGAVEKGSLTLETASAPVCTGSGLFGIYIPPFSIYRGGGTFRHLTLSLYVTSEPEFTGVSPQPVFFSTEEAGFQGTKEQMDDLVKNCRPAAGFPSSDFDPLALEAKGIIETEYASLFRISTLAERLGAESWELSRIFRKNFGITPLRYLNSLRTIEAIYRILEEGKNSRIIDTAFNVGFRDLSRFNKQFRRYTRFNPGKLFS